MTEEVSQKTIIECPRCAKEICLHLDILGDLVVVSQEQEQILPGYKSQYQIEEERRVK